MTYLVYRHRNGRRRTLRLAKVSNENNRIRLSSSAKSKDEVGLSQIIEKHDPLSFDFAQDEADWSRPTKRVPLDTRRLFEGPSLKVRMVQNCGLDPQTATRSRMTQYARSPI